MAPVFTQALIVLQCYLKILAYYNKNIFPFSPFSHFYENQLFIAVLQCTESQIFVLVLPIKTLKKITLKSKTPITKLKTFQTANPPIYLHLIFVILEFEISSDGLDFFS